MSLDKTDWRSLLILSTLEDLDIVCLDNINQAAFIETTLDFTCMQVFVNFLQEFLLCDAYYIYLII